VVNLPAVTAAHSAVDMTAISTGASSQPAPRGAPNTMQSVVEGLCCGYCAVVSVCVCEHVYAGVCVCVCVPVHVLFY